MPSVAASWVSLTKSQLDVQDGEFQQGIQTLCQILIRAKSLFAKKEEYEDCLYNNWWPRYPGGRLSGRQVLPLQLPTWQKLRRTMNICMSKHLFYEHFKQSISQMPINRKIMCY